MGGEGRSWGASALSCQVNAGLGSAGTGRDANTKGMVVGMPQSLWMGKSLTGQIVLHHKLVSWVIKIIFQHSKNIRKLRVYWYTTRVQLVESKRGLCVSVKCWDSYIWFQQWGGVILGNVIIPGTFSSGHVVVLSFISILRIARGCLKTKQCFVWLMNRQLAKNRAKVKLVNLKKKNKIAHACSS